MKLLDRLFPSPAAARDELKLDEVEERAHEKRSEAERAIERFTPEIAKRAEIEEALRQASLRERAQ